MTTQADQQLLDRIARFARTPRNVTLDSPATLIVWVVDRVDPQWEILETRQAGRAVSIDSFHIPVSASPEQVQRILHLIPPPLLGTEPPRSNEHRLASALWRLVVEYGGDPRIDAISSRFREASESAVSLLEELGWYQKGRGFIPR